MGWRKRQIKARPRSSEYFLNSMLSSKKTKCGIKSKTQLVQQTKHLFWGRPLLKKNAEKCPSLRHVWTIPDCSLHSFRLRVENDHAFSFTGTHWHHEYLWRYNRPCWNQRSKCMKGEIRLVSSQCHFKDITLIYVGFVIIMRLNITAFFQQKQCQCAPYTFISERFCVSISKSSEQLFYALRHKWDPSLNFFFQFIFKTHWVKIWTSKLYNLVDVCWENSFHFVIMLLTNWWTCFS